MGFFSALLGAFKKRTSPTDFERSCEEVSQTLLRINKEKSEIYNEARQYALSSQDEKKIYEQKISSYSLQVRKKVLLEERYLQFIHHLFIKRIKDPLSDDPDIWKGSSLMVESKEFLSCVEDFLRDIGNSCKTEEAILRSFFIEVKKVDPLDPQRKDKFVEFEKELLKSVSFFQSRRYEDARNIKKNYDRIAMKLKIGSAYFSASKIPISHGKAAIISLIAPLILPSSFWSLIAMVLALPFYAKTFGGLDGEQIYGRIERVRRMLGI